MLPSCRHRMARHASARRLHVADSAEAKANCRLCCPSGAGDNVGRPSRRAGRIGKLELESGCGGDDRQAVALLDVGRAVGGWPRAHVRACSGGLSLLFAGRGRGHEDAYERHSHRARCPRCGYGDSRDTDRARGELKAVSMCTSTYDLVYDTYVYECSAGSSTNVLCCVGTMRTSTSWC